MLRVVASKAWHRLNSNFAAPATMLVQTQRFALGATHKRSIQAVPLVGHALRAVAPVRLTTVPGGRPGFFGVNPEGMSPFRGVLDRCILCVRLTDPCTPSAGLSFVCRAIAEDAPASEQEEPVGKGMGASCSG